MKQIVWLSYDIGEDGDFSNLYSWLKEHDAQECGNSVAFFTFESEASDFDGFMEELMQSIEHEVNLTEGNRLYAISKKGEHMAGRFIYGRRKESTPWDSN